MSTKVFHGQFTLTRRFNASPAKVFKAFSDPAKKRRWFAEGKDFTVHEFEMDFRTGGRDYALFAFKDGPNIFNEGFYLDVRPDELIVHSYAMGTPQGRFSASLLSIAFEADGAGTLLTVTEQGAYFDGETAVKNREEGTRELLEALAKELGE